jgi:hypothetical protein
MTQEDQEHEDLKRLFEATAEGASGPTLTKLAARAADIPQLVGQKRRFLPRWAWGPAFAGAAMTLGGVLALHTMAPKRQPVPSQPVASVAVATASAREVNAAAPRATPPDDSSDSPELLGDADEGARFDVSGPQSDRDLDAWLAATKDLSGGT